MEAIVLISKMVFAATSDFLISFLSSRCFTFILLLKSHTHNTIPGSVLKPMSSFAIQSQRSYLLILLGKPSVDPINWKLGTTKELCTPECNPIDQKSLNDLFTCITISRTLHNFYTQ
uniref:Uncharacterized protein n=1 Tax=Glossina pallidipes TaxID=7398 RepID=A0A1B0AHX8_GLOPL